MPNSQVNQPTNKRYARTNDAIVESCSFPIRDCRHFRDTYFLSRIATRFERFKDHFFVGRLAVI